MHEADGAHRGSLTPGGLRGGVTPGNSPDAVTPTARRPDRFTLDGRAAGPGPADGPRLPGGGPRSRVKGLLVYLVVAVLAGWAGAGATLAAQRAGPSRAARMPAEMAAGRPEAMNVGGVYDKVEPGVVDVAADLQYLDETAEGTGIVIDAVAGLVLTNNHVIDGATSVTVTPVMSGNSVRARVLGYDAADDIALLQLPGVTGLKAVTIGNSSGVTVGTPVLAIGNEAGQGGPPTVAPGVISSLDRIVEASDRNPDLTEVLHGMLQTSADIRPGDSGGPLADAAGQVIGIDTAAGGSTVYSGYAIPINPAMSVARLISAGRASARIQIGLPAFLGALIPRSGSPDPRRQASQARQQTGIVSGSGRVCSAGGTTAIPASIAPAGSGALVDGVVCGTPAAAVGLAAGDVIISIGGRPVTSPDALTAILDTYRPGSMVQLAWISPGGNAHTALVTLGAGPAG